MNIIDSILQRMVCVSQAQKKFLVILFSTILLAYGKVNFTNLSRYSSLSEKTYRRHFLKSFNFPQFNQLFLQSAFSHPNTLIAVIDCSFLKKSGKKTAGKDYFFNSIAGKAELGLEISVISIVEVETRLAYSLTVQQTPKRSELSPENKPKPVQTKKTRKSSRKISTNLGSSSELTRVDDYIQHLRNTRTFCPDSVRYLVADGYYYRSKFCSAVRDLNLDFIGKLRTDANLRYLYTGAQNKRGAPRKYDGKVDFNDLSRFTFVFEYYQARFQIEFIFRDAKQFTGLSDCQSPHSQRLDFHFNASLTALNLAKYQAYHSRSSTSPFVFSMASFKRLEFNHHLLLTFIDKLDLDPNLILNHPNLPSVLSYGTLAA